MNTQLLQDIENILANKVPGEAATREAVQTEELDESDQAGTIIQHLALAAQVAGVDLDDDAQLKDFMTQVRTVVVKDSSKLKGLLHRWTASKGRSAAKATKAAVR